MAFRPLGGGVTRELAAQIGAAIVRGSYASGERLPTEAELSLMHQTSRTATREAIKMLTAKGLVSSLPKRGTFVEDEARWNLLDPDVLRWLLDSQLSISLVEDFLTMRLAIEPAAALMAASKQGNVDDIESALLMMREAEKGLGDAVAADSAFHMAVLCASGNRFFSQMAPFVGTALRVAARLTNRIKGVPMASVAAHERIFTAISNGHAQEAHQATTTMIQEALRLIRSQPPIPY